jgi:hypothetical protein
VAQIVHTFDGAVDKLDSEKGRRQNGVCNTDGFKNSQGGLSWKIRYKASICLSAAGARNFRKKCLSDANGRATNF